MESTVQQKVHNGDVSSAHLSTPDYLDKAKATQPEESLYAVLFSTAL